MPATSRLFSSRTARRSRVTRQRLAKASADPAAGASLYGESFCASCHAVQNAAGNMVGGDVGPELTRIGSKVKPEWLQAWLRNPRVYDPATGMPHYRFNDGQVAALSGFLLAKADSDLLANVHLDSATPEQIAHGKRLVSDYGCASCHEIAGIRKPENFAPELSRIGSKPVTQLIFLLGHAAHVAGLHRRKDQAAARVLAGPEDAAVHLHSAADRLTDDCLAFAE